MSMFSKRETLTQNLAYMAIMAALNVIVVLLSTLIPFLLFILVFILPLTSLVVTYYCKKRYFAIYAIVTVLLCMLVTLWNIADTLFYVIPSLFSGFVFGLFLEKKYSILLTIVVASIIQEIFTYISIPVVELMYGRDIVYDLVRTFNLENFSYVNYLKHMFIAFVALGQMTLTYLVIIGEANKFDISSNDNDEELPVALSVITITLFAVLFAFIFQEFVYVFVICALYLGAYLFIALIDKKKTYINITIVVIFIIGFFLVSGLFQFLNKNKPLGLMSIISLPLLLSLLSLFNKYLLSREKVDRINNR